MSAPEVAGAAEGAVEVAVVPRRYRRSALVAGVRVSARTWRVTLPVVALAAAAQALLVVPDPVPGESVAAAVLALVSFLVMAAALVLVVAAVLESVDRAVGVAGAVDGSAAGSVSGPVEGSAAGSAAGSVDRRVSGRVGWSAVLARARRRWWVVGLWFLGWVVAVSIGFALWIVPGVIVVLVTPYLFLAAMDRGGNALAADLAAIRARVGRWLLTSIVSGVLIGLAWLVAAVGGFFLPGPAAALLTWVWSGLLAVWLLATWAVVYRSTPGGVRA